MKCKSACLHCLPAPTSPRFCHHSTWLTKDWADGHCPQMTRVVDEDEAVLISDSAQFVMTESWAGLGATTQSDRIWTSSSRSIVGNKKLFTHCLQPFLIGTAYLLPMNAGSPLSFLVAERINLKLLSRTRRRSTRAAAAAVQNLNISALPHQHQILNIWYPFWRWAVNDYLGRFYGGFISTGDNSAI